MKKEDVSQPEQTCDSLFNLFLRIFWSLIGNVVLFFSALFILQHKGPVFYNTDIVFWCIAVAIVFARLLEIKLYGSQTNDGKLVTIAHWRRYAAIFMSLTTLLWIVVHLINYLFLNK